MSKNYMADVAKMLGIELGEEFNVVDKDGKQFAYNPLHIEAEGLIDCNGYDYSGSLESILIGTLEIIKKPWKPKEGEEYYYIVYGAVLSTIFHNTTEDNLMRLRMGNFFKTKSEAEDNATKWEEYINQEPDMSWRV